MKVINFFGGPGSGKTTLATSTLSILKTLGIKASYITEVGTDMIEAGRGDLLKDPAYQVFITNNFLEKVYHQKRLGTEYLITDCPLNMQISVYGKGISTETINSFNLTYNSLVINDINVRVRRIKPFLQYKRCHSYDQAIELDEELNRLKYDYEIPGHFSFATSLAENILGKTLNKKGVILVGPSGSGKTTLSNHLVQYYNRFEKIITCTTRNPRPGEIQNKDYNFITKEFFHTNLNKFLEYVEYDNNIYGTLMESFETSNGKLKIAALDFNGWLKIKEMYGDQYLGILLLPDKSSSIKRLNDRTSSETRIAKLDEEFQFLKENQSAFNYILNTVEFSVEDCCNFINNVMKN